LSLKAKKVVISCAVTGGAHTPSMSEYLPITPEEIASQAIEASPADARAALNLKGSDRVRF
jgi:uncharacterized protein (DUF849 family)